MCIASSLDDAQGRLNQSQIMGNRRTSHGLELLIVVIRGSPDSALGVGAGVFGRGAAAELAPEVALDKPPGLKLTAPGLNLNSFAWGLSFEAGAVIGRPSNLDAGALIPYKPCSHLKP